MDKIIANAVVLTLIAFCMVPEIVGTKLCWDSTWYNNSAPTNRSEYENLPKISLDAICVTGSPIAAQCQDNRGEPFTNHKVDRFNKYEATCNVTHGLVCNPFTNTTKTCPDFAIQYGCDCASTAGATVGATVVHPGNSASTSNSTSGIGGNNSHQQRGRDQNIGAKGHPCIFVLMLCLVMKYVVLDK